VSFTLLLEIGCEELPSSFVDAALEALPDLFRTRLGALRLTHDEIQALGTPRRLTAIVRAVADAQSDLDETVVGPPETAAYKDGKPTKAAEAFANKLGVALDALAVQDVAAQGGKKPGRYLVGRRVEKGRPAAELLGPMLADVCRSIPFRKSMRWADYDTTFGRPVQWLVGLAGDRVIDFEFAHQRSGRRTRGHRFLAPAFFDIGDASSYVEQLRLAHVLVDRREREHTMMERVNEAARALGGVADPDPDLIRENASLVEEPHVVAGGFDPAFLELPAAVIRAVARGHQKYFVVQKTAQPDAALLPHYLAVVNTAKNPANVRKGTDRVMRARLADARFFFDEDKKLPLERRVDKLAGIVFHARLGTVRDKVARMEKIARHLADRLGLDSDAGAMVERAAHLCKADLVTLMVGEFPELQGTMGRAYALASGEPPRVADAVRDHYAPVGHDGAVATDDVARVVGLADRVDTLAGGLAVGLQPTGAADPFALRRACIGVLRTLLEEAPGAYARVDLSEVASFAHGLFGQTWSGTAAPKLDHDAAATTSLFEAFATERLRGLLETRTSRAAASAVLAGFAWVDGARVAPVRHPAYALAKARVLQETLDSKAAWLETAREVDKRLLGISKGAEPELAPRERFTKDTDGEIVALVSDLDEKTRRLTDEHAVRLALVATADLAQRLGGIFADTLVNDPKDEKTPARLGLLAYGRSCMLRIADFTKLGP
jgi:glycyl-tRNA synthetase beta chain